MRLELPDAAKLKVRAEDLLNIRDKVKGSPNGFLAKKLEKTSLLASYRSLGNWQFLALLPSWRPLSRCV
jgi:hypothetical protein